MKHILGIFIVIFFLNCSSHKSFRLSKSDESNLDSLSIPNTSLDESEYQTTIPIDSIRISSPEIFMIGNPFSRSNYVWDTILSPGRISLRIVALKDSNKVFDYTDVDLNEIFYQYRDSFNNWVTAFRPIDKEREMKKLVFYIGDNFFMNRDSSINKRISKILFENFQDSIRYLIRNDSNVANYYRDRQKYTYFHKNIFDQIWEEDNVFFTRNPYNDFTNIKGLSNKVLNQIYSLKINQDSINQLFYLVDSNGVKQVINSIQKLNDDNVKCKMYLILWQYLLAHNLINEYLKPITEMDKLVVQSSKLDKASKAQWNLSIAKMYATINLQYYSSTVFAYLKRSSALLDRNTSIGFTKSYKIELTRAMFWALLPGLWSKEQALRLTVQGFFFTTG